MNISKVGNQTSSQDPQAVNSRVFVGNLNTFQIVKTDVEKIFQKYGRIAGISMHKGYAFVQFTSPFDARSACLGEDGKTLCGQVLDVNMVNEPKEHVAKLKGQKRQKEKEAAAATQILSYYVTSLGTVIQQPAQASMGAAAKRARVEENEAEEEEEGEEEPPEEDLDLEALKTYSTPDILICGNCRMMFNTIQEIIGHKRHYCKLRFTCKCSEGPEESEAVPGWLQCSTCQAGFDNPWDLMEHVQDVHTMNIYELSGSEHDDNHNQSAGDCSATAANLQNGCYSATS